LLVHDFEYKARSGFERPFACSFPGCGEAFSRAYTLKIHEKSHKLFANYHKWKKEPQLFLDADNQQAAKEFQNAKDARTLLPPLVQADLDQLRKSTAAKAFELTFGSEAFSIEDEEGKGGSGKTQIEDDDPFDNGGELSWPGLGETPALSFLSRLPQSRDGRDSPFSPMGTPWQNREIFSPMNHSRTGSRGGSRGFSRSSESSSPNIRFGVTLWGDGKVSRPMTAQTDDSAD
jgi:hypothetical protein